MAIVRLAAAALLTSLSLAAPAAEPTAPAAGQLLGSCSVGELSCTDFEKGVGSEAKAACVKYKLVWSEKACPAKKVVGTCVKKEGAGLSYTHSYAPGTPATAKQACANTPGGTFVP